MKRCFKLFDLYINKFGHEISYDELMKAVPLAQTKKDNVIAQKVAVGLSIFFYVLKHATMYEETYGNIRENNLEILFAF